MDISTFNELSKSPVPNLVYSQMPNNFLTTSYIPARFDQRKEQNQLMRISTSKKSRINNRQKTQKNVPMSFKPITCTKFADNLFLMGPPSPYHQTEQNINKNTADNRTNNCMIGSLFINTNINNRKSSTKKIRENNTNSFFNSNIPLRRKNQNKFVNVTNNRAIYRRETVEQFTLESMNNTDFNKLISSKSIIKNQFPERYPIETRKKISSTSLKTSTNKIQGNHLKDENDYDLNLFNIIGLRPCSMVHRINRQSVPKIKRQNLQQQQGQSELLVDNSEKNIEQKYNKNLIRKLNMKKNNIANQGYYFGKVNQKNTAQQNMRLKILYYKDLIWKVYFNQGFKVVDNQRPARFYIGKGNNSKLVKTIMEKRYWWVHETKIQNANIIWTQLKTCLVYQSQTDSINLTSTQLKKDKESTSKQIDGLLSEEVQIQNNQWQQKRLQQNDKCSLLLTENKFQKWKSYIDDFTNQKRQKKSIQHFPHRKQLQQRNLIKEIQRPSKVTNHLQYSRMVGNKKALYRTMKMYQALVIAPQELKYLPLTFHITNGIEDQEYLKFLQQFYKKSKQKDSMWIVKPGQMSNRGKGIKVCTKLQQIKNILKSKETHSNGVLKSYIVQEYIMKPLLYKGRKFDLRHYIMITSTEGKVRGYFYQEGYVRTTSYKYTVNQNNACVHLTNDAVQKHCKDYGKYEKGNKLSYEQFEKYVKQTYNGTYSFYQKVYPQIRNISRDIMKASYFLIDPKRRVNNFQIFGLDIMIDDQFKTWLIEVNTNPCLQLSSPVLARLIPKMLDNAFSIALDPQFPPPPQMVIPPKKNYLPENSVQQNQFQLIFDEVISGSKLNLLYQNQKQQIQLMDGYKSDEEAYQSHEDQYDAQY